MFACRPKTKLLSMLLLINLSKIPKKTSYAFFDCSRFGQRFTVHIMKKKFQSMRSIVKEMILINHS
ncbi:hypothetical protein CUU60_26990 (plasmid) [Paenibacillus polymyxa ATCC 842]|nr:hypothetical protein CUU60_26990 [Paenibacillus polymyxa ATCC 842]